MSQSYLDHVHVLGYKAFEVLEEFEKEKQTESEMLKELDLQIAEHAFHMEGLQDELNQINMQAQSQTQVSQEDQRRMQERQENFQRQLREMEENHRAELQRIDQTLQNACSEALSRQRDRLNREHEEQLGALRRQLH